MKKRVFSLLLAGILLLGLASCAEQGTTDSPAPAGQPTTAGNPSSAPENSVAGIYTFEEAAMGGQFTVPWTLELREDGTYTITEENPFMGTNTYDGTYTVEADVVITGPFEGEPPVATFFSADKRCKWRLDGASCLPVDYDPDEAPAGLPGGPGGPSQTDDLKGTAYASGSPAQVCDIYQPEGVERAPVIVLVHGGGFMFGDQGMTIIQPVIEAGLAHGYAVVSVDYRKSSEAVFPAALADVKAAVRFVRTHAEEYGFDPDRIAIWGESAGAYLSLMTALTPNVAELDGDVPDNTEAPSGVAALVSFYAPVEFYTMYEEAGRPESAAESFESKLLGQDITADKDDTYTTYWETYQNQLPKDLKAWIQAGDSDQRVPCTQSVNFAQRLAGYLGEENVEHTLLPGADHEDDAFYTDENLSAVFTWLDSFMKG